MAEEEKSDLKSSSSFESSETFDEKMARIRAVLKKQTEEIENHSANLDFLNLSEEFQSEGAERAENDADAVDSTEIERPHKLPWQIGISSLIILIAIGSAVYLQQREEKWLSIELGKTSSSVASTSQSRAKVESSSEISESSGKIVESSSSSITADSSLLAPTQISPASTRSEIIASVSPSYILLDPNITGQEPEFSWPAGLQEEVLAKAQTDGWGIDGYRFIPAQIAGDQGWVNLYNASGKFVLSVNLVTHYILQ